MRSAVPGTSGTSSTSTITSGSKRCSSTARSSPPVASYDPIVPDPDSDSSSSAATPLRSARWAHADEPVIWTGSEALRQSRRDLDQAGVDERLRQVAAELAFSDVEL